MSTTSGVQPRAYSPASICNLTLTTPSIAASVGCQSGHRGVPLDLGPLHFLDGWVRRGAKGGPSRVTQTCTTPAQGYFCLGLWVNSPAILSIP